MFLEKYEKKKSEEAVIGKIKNSVKVIQKERDRIGNEIEQLINQNIFTNKEIIDKVLENTTLSRNMVNGILEEYNFNKNYPQLKEKINIKEIVKIKKYFKDNSLGEKEREKELTENYEELIKKAELGYRENKYKHQIVLEEEGQNLYVECKSIVEKMIGRPIKNKTEMFSLVLSDFYVNNVNKDD